MNDDIPEEFVTMMCAEWLVARGYCVTPNIYVEWITPRELSQRLGIAGSTLHEKLHSQTCPRFDGEYGESGRLIKLRLNPNLNKYLGLP